MDWRTAFEARARAHWTPSRLADLARGTSLRVRPDNAAALLRAVGVLDANAALLPSRMRKYRQVNHMLSFLVPALEQLPQPVHLVDAGCGRSALGFLVAWWLAETGRDGAVLGIDRNADVLVGCRERAQRAGLSMAFAEADLGDADLPVLWQAAFDTPLALTGILALHACDTATDHALALADRHRAPFFAVAPCCQAELSRKWAHLTGPLASIYANPHLRRTLAATVTDALRTELMRSRGYDVRAVEYVEAHHTPKNTLIYGHRTDVVSGEPEALVAATGGATILLAELLTTPGLANPRPSERTPGG